MVLFDCVRISWEFVFGTCAGRALLVIAGKVEPKDASATVDCLSKAISSSMTNLQ